MPHPLTVVELANGKVIGDLRMVATAGDVVIGGLQSLSDCLEPQNHYLLKPRRRCRFLIYRRGRALLLGSGNNGNYYHWLMDSLPRWRILQAAKFSEYDFVLLPGPSSPFEDEVLDRLEIPPAKRLRCSKNFVHQFERLVVPSMPFPVCEVPAWVCAWLRSLFPVQNGGPEKIYVSRRGTPRRRLVNEAELEAQLQAAGFVSIQAERFPVVEQARLFSSAKCVVSCHGAGLANIIFVPASGLIMELWHPDVDYRPAIKNMAAAAGLRYTALIGRNLGQSRSRNEEAAEFEIDPSAVVRAIVESEAQTMDRSRMSTARLATTFSDLRT